MQAKDSATSAIASATSSVATAEPEKPKPTPRPLFKDVDIKKLLSEYDDNEVRADTAFKGKKIRFSGKVNDIKKDITGDVYVTMGTGKELEIPQVQCFVAQDSLADASALSKSQMITMSGVVDGLMMNVLIKDCVINPLAALCNVFVKDLGLDRRCEPDKDGITGFTIGKGKDDPTIIFRCEDIDAGSFLTVGDVAKKEGLFAMMSSTATCFLGMRVKEEARIDAATKAKMQSFLDGLK